MKYIFENFLKKKAYEKELLQIGEKKKLREKKTISKKQKNRSIIYFIKSLCGKKKVL